MLRINVKLKEWLFTLKVEARQYVNWIGRTLRDGDCCSLDLS
jgi:hypothetical protein